jgi:hypothetical protein
VQNRVERLSSRVQAKAACSGRMGVSVPIAPRHCAGLTVRQEPSAPQAGVLQVGTGDIPAVQHGPIQVMEAPRDTASSTSTLVDGDDMADRSTNHQANARHSGPTLALSLSLSVSLSK